MFRDTHPLEKIVSIRDHLQRVRDHKSVAFEEFLADRDRQDIVSFNLVLALQGCADLACHVVSEKGWGIPNSYHDAIAILAKHNHFSSRQSEAYKKLFSFRHDIIHEFAQVDPAEVYRVMMEELDELDKFVADIKSHIRS